MAKGSTFAAILEGATRGVLKGLESRKKEKELDLTRQLLFEREKREQEKEKRDIEKFEFEKEQTELERQRKSEELELKKRQLELKQKDTPGQRKVDQEFAKEYDQFILFGGIEEAKSDLKEMDRILKDLEKAPIKGSKVLGATPKWLRIMIGGERGVDIQERIEQVAAKNIKQVLDTRFTEREAQQFLSRSYNPQLGKENINRLKRSIEFLKNTTLKKIKAVKYWEKHGTLRGFKGDIDSKETKNILGLDKLDKKETEVKERDEKKSFEEMTDDELLEFLSR